MRILKLKVFTNKSNGQTAVHLPKKIFEKIPSSVEIKVPQQFLKQPKKLSGAKWKK